MLVLFKRQKDSIYTVCIVTAFEVGGLAGKEEGGGFEDVTLFSTVLRKDQNRLGVLLLDSNYQA